MFTHKHGLITVDHRSSHNLCENSGASGRDKERKHHELLLGGRGIGDWRQMEQRNSALHLDSGVWARSRRGSRVASVGVLGMAQETDPHAVNLLQSRIRLVVALHTRRRLGRH